MIGRHEHEVAEIVQIFILISLCVRQTIRVLRHNVFYGCIKALARYVIDIFAQRQPPNTMFLPLVVFVFPISAFAFR